VELQARRSVIWSGVTCDGGNHADPVKVQPGHGSSFGDRDLAVLEVDVRKFSTPWTTVNCDISCNSGYVTQYCFSSLASG
jgi:hypothetical protein